MTLEGFTRGDFSDAGVQRPIYRRGVGPGVLVIHETPGITPQVAAFGRRVADAGFTAVLPSLFGAPGRGYGLNVITQLARVCVAREFHVLARRGSSPITAWLRALARELHAELGGPGVGALGMCITGNFALTLMLDPWVIAPVLCQPSLPFALTADLGRAVHLSDADLARAGQRCAAEGVAVLGVRFTADFMCPRARFDTLRAALGPGFEAIEIDSGPGNPHGIPRWAHSVLTRDLVDETGHPTRAALERVLEFLRERLRTT